MGARRSGAQRARRIALAAAALLAVAGVVYVCVLPFVPVTTPWAYPWLRQQWAPQAIAHFPRSLPDQARARGFFYHPGPMQAATMMELRVEHAPGAYARELARLHALRASGDAERYCELHPGKRVFPSSPGLALEVRFLHCRPTFYDGEADWNHGQLYDYAWHDASRQVVYWTEYW